jgi:hypothetical protein
MATVEKSVGKISEESVVDERKYLVRQFDKPSVTCYELLVRLYPKLIHRFSVNYKPYLTSYTHICVCVYNGNAARSR